MGMPEPALAPQQTPDVCTSISRFGGFRCSGRAGHKEALHRFGAFFWDERGAAPPAHPPAIESVLRQAARELLPRVGCLRECTIGEIARLIKDVREHRYFDVETAGAIESWLAVYEGREGVR